MSKSQDTIFRSCKTSIRCNIFTYHISVPIGNHIRIFFSTRTTWGCIDPKTHRNAIKLISKDFIILNFKLIIS